MRTLFLLLCVVFVFSCTRPGNDPLKQARLLPFTVTVVERNPNTAIIQWTPGTDDTTSVKYRVILEGKVVSSNLVERTDTLQYLSANLSYSGSVCVYTQSGDSVFAPFILNKLSFNPRPLKPFTVSVIDRSAASAIIEWTECLNPYDWETVKYDVILQGQVIHSDVTNRIDTLRNLNMDSVYTGKVMAYTIGGDTASAVFQLDKVNGLVFYGAQTEGMVCYNLFTGRSVWRFQYSYDEFSEMPLIVDSSLYINVKFSAGGEGMYAFNIKNGQALWKTQIPNNNSIYQGIGPVHKNGVVYTTLLNGVYALNAASGQVLWSYTPPNRRFTFNPVIDGNLLFTAMKTEVPVGLSDTWTIVAINTTSGLPIWENEVSYNPSSNPVVYNGLLIYGASDGKIYALNESNGTVNWSRDFSVYYSNRGANLVSPVIYNNSVIVHSGNFGYFALSAQTGSTIWNYSSLLFPSSPTIGNGNVYFITNDGLVAVNLSNGVRLWVTAVSSLYRFYPIVVKNRIYLSTYQGFEIYNALNGQLIQRLTTISGSSFHGPPVIVSDSLVYYPAESGMLQ